jgi:small conductance mechanosensitive channel
MLLSLIGGAAAIAAAPSATDPWVELTTTALPFAMPTAQALVVAIITVVLARHVSWLVRASLQRAGAEPSIGLLIGRLCYFAIVAIGAVWILAIFNIPLTALVAALGAVSLAVSLALQDILKNLVAGLYLLIEKPFRIGDRLVVRTFDGTVENVDIRTTQLRTSSGERVLVPNAVLFAEVLVNYGPPAAVADPEIGPAEEGTA